LACLLSEDRLPKSDGEVKRIEQKKRDIVLNKTMRRFRGAGADTGGVMATETERVEE